MGMATHILDWTSGGSGNDSIQIEAYPIDGHTGINPYARFIVYPASANPIIKVDIGSVTKIGSYNNAIYHEKISFNGSRAANAQFRIDSLIDTAQGYFFDAHNNIVNPSFSIINGVLIADQEVWGAVFIAYYSQGVVYEYDADIEDFTTSIGTVFAFRPDKKGIAASYDIPPHAMGEFNREDVITVYRKVIVQGDKEFEMPDGLPAFPDGNNYLSYPTALEEQKPTLGDAYAIVEYDRHVVFVANSTYHDDLQTAYWFNPAALSTTFYGVKWLIKDRIPASPTATISADLITVLQERKAELIALYGITP